jgi:hypothetical protein
MWKIKVALIICFRWADQCMPGHDHKRNVGKKFELFVIKNTKVSVRNKNRFPGLSTLVTAGAENVCRGCFA